MNLPLRGEVWVADLGMIAKVRPVLVVSVPFGDHDYALFQIVPHTTSVRGSQFEVALDVRGLERGVFNIQGSQAVPRINLLRRIAVLTPAQMQSVEDAWLRWLGIRTPQ